MIQGGNKQNSNSGSGGSQSSRKQRGGDQSQFSGKSNVGSSKSTTPRKSSRHDQLRELVGEIVSNMGYDGIPIVRIKGNKYLIGTEVQYLQ